uniref:Putative gag protein n=1 Tax=Zea mays TaxID=4577 RepID=Q8W0X8_MAIZE|nr:putative gag protein [Zea mays]
MTKDEGLNRESFVKKVQSMMMNAADLQATPWPPSYKPLQLPMYDGHSDPKQFLMSYKTTISSYGGNTVVMVKSFVMAVRSVTQT